MKKEDSEILKKLGKNPGFKVPDNYFADFSKNLTDSLPEIHITEEEKPTLWSRISTYVYMAAMFAGIWCMMQIFNGIGIKDKGIYNPEIVAGFQNEANVDDFMLHGDISEYDILTYEDSVAADDEIHLATDSSAR